MKRKSRLTLGTFKLRVGKSKTGKGLFAVDKIPKGVWIIEYIGKEIPKKDQKKKEGKYLFTINKDRMVDGNIPQNIARYINHSCKPNCEADGPREHAYISSLHTIKPGEELTYDYGKEYFDEIIKPLGCKCEKCSKIK